MVGERTCTKCWRRKPASAFRTFTSSHGITKPSARCIPCAKQAKEARRIKQRYGLTQQEFEKLLEQQGYACAICRDIFLKTPLVDHDHTTGRVRGLLCLLCNNALGFLREDKNSLLSAVEYLERYA